MSIEKEGCRKLWGVLYIFRIFSEDLSNVYFFFFVGTHNQEMIDFVEAFPQLFKKLFKSIGLWLHQLYYSLILNA